MALVMAKKSWPGVFRRSVRDDRGQISHTLEFAPGEPVEVTGADLKAIEGDLGVALQYAAFDAKQRPRVADADGSPVREAASDLPPESGPDDDTALVPLDQLTIDELKKIAGEEKIDVSACKRKQDFVEALRKAGVE